MKLPSFSPLFRPRRGLIVYCVVIGLIGALAALAFDLMVDFAQHYLLEGVGHYHPPEASNEIVTLQPWSPTRLWLPLVTTLGGLLSGWVVYRWAPEAEGHGTDAAIGAYHQFGGEVRDRIPFVKAIASALTIGSGGVAGREGPTAQISVGLGQIIARWAGLRGQERRNLLLAGMSAGLAAMFRAPLGMAIFSVEILYSGMVFESEALIYTVIAAVSSYAFYGLFAGWSRLFDVPPDVGLDSPAAFLSFALLGLLAGVLGAVLPTVLYRMRDLFRRFPGPPHLRPAVGGLAVGLIALAVPEILGTGYEWVELAVLGKLSLTLILLILLLKAPAMALTIGSGGSGGVFAPTVVLGAMLGAAVGTVLDQFVPAVDVDVAAFVVVGMAAVFAGAARTPISTLIMVAEMTGDYELIAPAMLANILAFMVQKSLTANSPYPTLYESQVESREDSPLHRGVFLRRAMEIFDSGGFDPSEVRLPRLVNMLRYGEPIPVSEGEGFLVAVDVDVGSELAGSTVADKLGQLSNLTAVAVLRGGEMLAPRGATRFEAGDRLLAVASQDAYDVLVRLARHAGQGS